MVVRGVAATLSFAPAFVPYEHTRYSFGSSWTNTVRALPPPLRLRRLRPLLLLSLPPSLSSRFSSGLLGPARTSSLLWCSFRKLSLLFYLRWDTRRASLASSLLSRASHLFRPLRTPREGEKGVREDG